MVGLTLCLGCATPDELPEGYRVPGASDISGSWSALKASSTPFEIRGDFNGDSVDDRAVILLRTDGPGWTLFAVLGSLEGPPTFVPLTESDGRMTAQSMAVAVVEPGEYQTACGKGYGQCEPSDPTVIRSDLPAINFFQPEGASSFFWWNTATRRFARTWMSD